MAKSSKKRTGLGKGLGALLKENTTPAQIDGASSHANEASLVFKEIAVDKIEANPWQPRSDFDRESLEELAASITLHGIIQPITVRRLDDDHYQLISGERRLQASKMANHDTIMAYIREADSQQMLEMGLIENIQREDLNAIEVALSYQRLISECNLKQEELGGRVGKKRSTVTNHLRLLKLPPQVQAAVRDRIISMGHARAILGLDTVDMQLDCCNEVVAKKLSVRQTEQLVKGYSENKMNPKAEGNSKGEDPNLAKTRTQLSSHFGTKVNLKVNEHNKGELKIPFDSVEELNRILDIINLK